MWVGLEVGLLVAVDGSRFRQDRREGVCSWESERRPTCKRNNGSGSTAPEPPCRTESERPTSPSSENDVRPRWGATCHGQHTEVGSAGMVVSRKPCTQTLGQLTGAGAA